mmetsp:Transcript_13875/g.24311  ORF Transcript_13875/g.24311 Transcript_13875/m.24311 type:complete len:98 (+) Transcript_13875:663-956(+)
MYMKNEGWSKIGTCLWGGSEGWHVCTFYCVLTCRRPLACNFDVLLAACIVSKQNIEQVSKAAAATDIWSAPASQTTVLVGASGHALKIFCYSFTTRL